MHLLPGVSRTRVEEVVADLLRVSDRDLPAALQDVGDELAFHTRHATGAAPDVQNGARGGRAAGSARQGAAAPTCRRPASRRD